MLCSLLLCGCLWLVTGCAHDDDWIDPTDMLNYDAASGTMRKPQFHDSEKRKSRFEDSFGVDLCYVFMVPLCLLCIVLLVASELRTYVRHYTKVICSFLALGGTFTSLVMEPWNYIGKGTGRFITALMKETPVLYQVLLFIIVALGVLVFCCSAGNSLHLLTPLGGPRREPYQGFQPGYRCPQEGNDFRPSGGAGDADSYYRGQKDLTEQGPYNRTSEGKRHVLRRRDVDSRIHTGHESPEVIPVSVLPDTETREMPQVSDLSETERREVLQMSDFPDAETREHPEVVSSAKGTGTAPGACSPPESSTAGSRPPELTSGREASGSVDGSAAAGKAQLQTDAKGSPEEDSPEEGSPEEISSEESSPEEGSPEEGSPEEGSPASPAAPAAGAAGGGDLPGGPCV